MKVDDQMHLILKGSNVDANTLSKQMNDKRYTFINDGQRGEDEILREVIVHSPKSIDALIKILNLFKKSPPRVDSPPNSTDKIFYRIETRAGQVFELESEIVSFQMKEDLRRFIDENNIQSITCFDKD